MEAFGRSKIKSDKRLHSQAVLATGGEVGQETWWVTGSHQFLKMAE